MVDWQVNKQWTEFEGDELSPEELYSAFRERRTRPGKSHAEIGINLFSSASIFLLANIKYRRNLRKILQKNGESPGS